MRIELDATQQTLLIPLYGRAAETRKRRPMLRDPAAVHILSAIDYDISQLKAIGQGARGAVMRTSIYDVWAQRFLAQHPAGTIVEIGTGLNTRFERLDNGTVHWFDLDLPDVIDLRRQFFADTDRRKMIAASVLDPQWVHIVQSSPGPYLLLAEAVLIYLQPGQVNEALTLIAGNFPGAALALDTGTQKMAEALAKHPTMRHMGARMTWTCEDPGELEHLVPGSRLLDSRTPAQPQPELLSRMPVPARVMLHAVGLLLRHRIRQYRLNLLQLPAPVGRS